MPTPVTEKLHFRRARCTYVLGDEVELQAAQEDSSWKHSAVGGRAGVRAERRVWWRAASGTCRCRCRRLAHMCSTRVGQCRDPRASPQRALSPLVAAHPATSCGAEGQGHRCCCETCTFWATPAITMRCHSMVCQERRLLDGHTKASLNCCRRDRERPCHTPPVSQVGQGAYPTLPA